MSSARQDRIKGAIDTMAARVLEFWAKLTGNPTAAAKGKAARGRGMTRLTKGRLKRRTH